MRNRNVAICHQTVASGDAIGNDILAMYDLLESLGLAPTILCEYVNGDLGSRRAVPSTALAKTVNSYGLVLYHHSIYWEQGEALLRAYAGAPILRYHNITPPHFFEPYSVTHATRCRQGHDQTRRLINLRGRHHWLADSDYNSRDLLTLGERSDRIAVVPPFTHVDRCLAQPTVATYHEHGPFYALFVGRLVPNKGHLTLLKILSAYKTYVHDDLLLCIIGPHDSELGSYRAELEAFIHHFDLPCRVYDRTSRDLLLELYRHCHVYLCMSEHEGFCVPIIEAQAVGLPVIAMDAAAVRHTAGPGQLIGPPPMDDADYLFYARLLREIFTNIALRRTVVRHGYRNVLTRFTGELIENALLETLWPRLRDLL